MTKHQTIQVVDSWDMTIGIIAELKHQLNGLDSGSVIKSQITGKEWIVKNRMLSNHACEKQKKFVSETTVIFFLVLVV